VLKNLFDEDAWEAVQSLYRLKLKVSTCRNCRKLCIAKFMKCTECKKSFHFKCQSITVYISGGKCKKPWVCTFCKDEVDKDNEDIDNENNTDDESDSE
jgi:hypothetical protein